MLPIEQRIFRDIDKWLGLSRNGTFFCFEPDVESYSKLKQKYLKTTKKEVKSEKANTV